MANNPNQPREDEIRARAQRYYEEAGAPEGRDEEFWLRAERDLREQASAGNNPSAPAVSNKSTAPVTTATAANAAKAPARAVGKAK